MRVKGRQPIKNLVPSWFAVVMGTGGLGNVFFNWGTEVTMLCGQVLAALAALLYLVIVPLWLLRWVLCPEDVKRDLHDPITVNFFVTSGVGTVIIATNIHNIWSQFLTRETVFALTFTLWLVACALVIACTAYTSSRLLFHETDPLPETMNFSWIMAPLGFMSLLLIGNPILRVSLELRASWSLSIYLMNGLCLGVGFFLFLFFGTVIFVRLINHPLPPAGQTPTFGILLAAPGLVVNALLDLGTNADLMGLFDGRGVLGLAALAVWGFGFWVVAVILLICGHWLRRGGIPFSLGWWAFIFPLAAYTIGSQKIAVQYAAPLTFGYTVFLTALLTLVWVYTAVNTVKLLKRS
jgi:C4-dicarboxylate transporter/malic acid transport protein